MTQWIEFFSPFDSKSWVFSNMTQRVGLFFFWIWLKRLEPSFEYDSKNWTFFSQCVSKNWTFFSNVTLRIEPLFEYDSENLNFCQINTTQSQRIELSFFFSIRLNELNTFLHVIHVFKWFKDIFWKNFSKNWIFIWLKEWYLTQRLEIYVFEIWFKELDFFFWSLADLKLFFQKLWRKELNLLLFDSKNWTLFCMTQRIEPFFSDLPQRIESFLSKCWLELSHFF